MAALIKIVAILLVSVALARAADESNPREQVKRDDNLTRQDDFNKRAINGLDRVNSLTTDNQQLKLSDDQPRNQNMLQQIMQMLMAVLQQLGTMGRGQQGGPCRGHPNQPPMMNGGGMMQPPMMNGGGMMQPPMMNGGGMMQPQYGMQQQQQQPPYGSYPNMQNGQLQQQQPQQQQTNGYRANNQVPY